MCTHFAQRFTAQLSKRKRKIHLLVNILQYMYFAIIKNFIKYLPIPTPSISLDKYGRQNNLFIFVELPFYVD